MKVRTVFMGTPQFAVTILESLLQSSCQVLAVYTQPDKPAGRRRPVVFPPVKKLALERQIPVIQPKTFKSSEVVEKLASFQPELIIVAAFGLFFPRKCFPCPNLPVLTFILHYCHGTEVRLQSLIPFSAEMNLLVYHNVNGRWNGYRADFSPGKGGDFFMDTTGSLSSKLADVGAKLLLETLPKWLGDELRPQAQDESQATYSKLITSKDAEIDWHLSAVELWRRVRAYNPWPSCYTWCWGKRLKIHKAIPCGGVAKGEIGK